MEQTQQQQQQTNPEIEQKFKELTDAIRNENSDASVILSYCSSKAKRISYRVSGYQSDYSGLALEVVWEVFNTLDSEEKQRVLTEIMNYFYTTERSNGASFAKVSGEAQVAARHGGNPEGPSMSVGSLVKDDRISEITYSYDDPVTALMLMQMMLDSMIDNHQISPQNAATFSENVSKKVGSFVRGSFATNPVPPKIKKKR